MSTLLELPIPTATIEWALLSPLVVLLLTGCVGILLEGTPSDVNVEALRGALSEIPGISDVHDLHVWTITSGLDCLSAHVVAAESYTHAALLKTLRDTLHEKFGLDHLTIQIEPEGFEESGVHG